MATHMKECGWSFAEDGSITISPRCPICKGLFTDDQDAEYHQLICGYRLGANDTVIIEEICRICKTNIVTLEGWDGMCATCADLNG